MEILLNQLVYFGFLQGIFLLAIYTLSPKNRKNISGYLALLVAVLMIGLSGRILNATAIFGTSSKFISISEFSNLLFGTTVYLFTRSSLLNQRFRFKDLVHYVPAVVYSTLILLMFIIPSSTEIRERYKDGGLHEHILLFIGFALFFNITYWVASFRIFIQFKEGLLSKRFFMRMFSLPTI